MVTDAITKRLNKVNYDLEGGNIYINRDVTYRLKVESYQEERTDIAAGRNGCCPASQNQRRQHKK